MAETCQKEYESLSRTLVRLLRALETNQKRCFNQGYDLRDAPLKLDVAVVKLRLLSLLICCEQDPLLVKWLQVDQITLGERQASSRHLEQALRIVCFIQNLGKVSEQDHEKLRNKSSLLDEGQVFLVSQAILLQSRKRFERGTDRVELKSHDFTDESFKSDRS